MDPSSKQTLVQVVDLIKKGDNQAAVKLLTELLGSEPQLEQGWYLLGVALQSPDRKRFAFQRVLKINPENQRAKQQLEKLGFDVPLPDPPPVAREAQTYLQPEEPSLPAPPAEETPETPAWAKPEPTHDDEILSRLSWLEPETPSEEEPDEPPAWGAPEVPPTDEQPETPAWAAPEPPLDEKPISPPSWLADDKPTDEEPLGTPSWLEAESPAEEEAISTPSWATPDLVLSDESTEGAPWLTPAPSDENGEIELPDWAKDIPDTPVEPSPAEESESEMPSWAQRIQTPSSEPFVEEPREIPAFSFDMAEDEPAPAPEPERKFQAEPEEASEESGQKRKRKTRKERKAEKLAAKQIEEEQAGEKTLQEELLGAEDTRKRPRVRWRPSRGLIIFFILIIICGALGGGAYYYQDTWIPVVTEIGPTVIAFVLQEPTPTPDYTATPTFTPVIAPSMPPTWTPGAGEVGLVADTPTPGVQTTPTVTPTPVPLPATIIEEMEKIEEQFTAIRELEAPVGIDREMMPKSKFGTFMEGVASSEIDWTGLEEKNIVYRALGFVADDYNPIQVRMNDLSDFVGGRYDADQNKIFLTGTGFYGMEKYIYSFEFGFALLNENYDIYTNYCQGIRDACQAESALVTGDVFLTQEMWLQTYPIQFNSSTYFDLDNPAPLFADDFAPPYFAARRNFGVIFGYPFVSHLYDSDGWQSVNYTYRYPPETTEQVIHPEKYDTREDRVLLYDPDLISYLGEGWELVERETLGEWDTYLLLAAPDYPAAVRPAAEAAEAAAGWGGDTYQVYFHPENDITVMSVHWNWDTSDDLDQFLASFEASQAGRFQDSVFEGPDEGVCWMLDNQYSCFYQVGRDVLWVFSTDLAALEAAKIAFTQFP